MLTRTKDAPKPPRRLPKSLWATRIMKRVTVILFFFFLISKDLLACKCGGQYSVEQEFEYSSLIFWGTVINIDTVGLEETINPDSLVIARELAAERSKTFLEGPLVLRATFRVARIYKNEIENDTITVYTASQSAACGYRFEINKSYIVYGYHHTNMYSFINIDGDRGKGFSKMNTFWTNHCTRTTDSLELEQQFLSEYLENK